MVLPTGESPLRIALSPGWESQGVVGPVTVGSLCGLSLMHAAQWHAYFFFFPFAVKSCPQK
eukprot:scaffold269491_cov16-Tisochrysis_lutea.AAC.1